MSNSGNISILSLDETDNSGSDTSGIYFFIDTKEDERTYERAVMKLEKDTSDNVTLSIEGDISCNDATFGNDLPTGRVYLGGQGDRAEWTIQFKSDDGINYTVNNIKDHMPVLNQFDSEVNEAFVEIRDQYNELIFDVQ